MGATKTTMMDDGGGNGRKAAMTKEDGKDDNDGAGAGNRTIKYNERMTKTMSTMMETMRGRWR